jgi:hypothetical protein
MELDNETANEILSGRSRYLERHIDGAQWLTLDGFSHASDDVLERFSAQMHHLEGIEIGLNRITPRAAKALVEMNVYILIFTDLHDLDEQAASALGACPFDNRPLRELNLRSSISEKAAASLVGEPPNDDEYDSPLSLSVPSINFRVAQALSRHTHELHVTVRDEMLSADVAEVLSSHAGYFLTVTCGRGFSAEALVALGSNSQKRAPKRWGPKNTYCVVDQDYPDYPDE